MHRITKALKQGQISPGEAAFITRVAMFINRHEQSEYVAEAIARAASHKYLW